MGGIDVYDYSLHRYIFKHKTKKWTKKVVICFFKMLLTFIWQMLKKKVKKLTQKKFLLLVIKWLLGDDEKVNLLHQPLYFDKRGKSVSCGSVTHFKCESCDVWLHPRCFPVHHK